MLAGDAVVGTSWWGWATTLQAGDRWPRGAGLRAMDALAARVRDRAPRHRDADGPGVGRPPVALPPSSPELNPAERLFEAIRRRVAGQVSAALDATVAAVEAFRAALDADPARVRQRGGWAWIDAAFEALPAPVGKAA